VTVETVRQNAEAEGTTGDSMMRKGAWIAVLGLMTASMGCSYWDKISTPRTAMEQLLISTAADRALATINLPIEGKDIFLDTQYLETVDKPYVVALLRERLGEKARLAASADKAQLILEVRSGSLAIDKSEFLLGFPAIPLPVPGLASIPQTPEITIYKSSNHRSRAKFALCATDTATSRQLAQTGILYAEARYTARVVLFIPFDKSDFLKELQARQITPAAAPPGPSPQ